MYANDLYLNNDYVESSYRTVGTTFAQPAVEGGSVITTINGSGGGMVTGPNITFSGGTTGMNFAGAGNTLTMSGTLVVANGGTGSTTAGGARTNLGAAASGANADITSLTGLTTPLSLAQGGTAAATAAAARTSLSVPRIHTAAVAPAVTDDGAAGFPIGTQWVDTVLDDAYISVDDSTGAAVWKKTTV